MKKIILILSILLVFNACSLNEDPSSDYVLLKIESIEMPATDFIINQTNYIKIKYRRPTTCHLFDGFYIEKNDDARTIGVRALKLNESNCEDATDEGPYEVDFEFKPTETGTYSFKFWTGDNNQGVDEYIVEEIVIN